MEPKLPTYDRFINPTLRTLDSMGGSAAVSELVERVADDMQLTNEELAIVHDPKRGTQSEVAYRMAWSWSWRLRDLSTGCPVHEVPHLGICGLRV